MDGWMNKWMGEWMATPKKGREGKGREKGDIWQADFRMLNSSE